MFVEKEEPGNILLVTSFAVYAVLTPLLSRFVSSSGVFGVLFTVPLFVAAWRWGRRVGIAAAFLGVVLNQAVWIWLHGSRDLVSASRAPDTASALVLEAAGFSLFACVIAGMRELKDRARRAEELKELSERNYLGLIELAPQGAAVVQDQRVAFCNDHLLDMFGFARSEVLGRRFDLMLHADERERALLLYRRRLEGEAGNAGEVRFLRQDGTVGWMDYVGKRIEWKGRPAALYLVSDITVKKSLEQQWRQSQKLEALGRLASGIAHDFNNILQVVVASLDSITVSSWDPPSVRRDIGLAQAAAASGASLTRQLLAFSRTRGAPATTVDLGLLLQRLEKMLECALGDSVALTVIMDEAPALIRADEGGLQQVFLNLAVNARDAMPGGGTFTIRTGGDGAPPAGAAIGAAPGAAPAVAPAGAPADLPVTDYVSVRVSDTGCGMDETTLEHLFEPFFTTKEPGQGTGLGLWIVHGIVARSGGRIDVQSVIGKGTTFIIRLPRAHAAVDAPRAAAEPRPPKGSERILLVEDDASVRSLVTAMLEAGGYTVDAVPDGPAALELCRRTSRRIDLLLTDVAMPGMGGRQLAERLRASRPETRILLMTGGDELPADPSAAAVIRKPFTSRQLLTEIRRVIDIAYTAGH